MNIPAIKRYLGRGLKVKHLTKTTLDHALKNPAYRGADVYVPIGKDAKESAPYLAFVRPSTGRILAVYVTEALVTPKMLDTLVEDIKREEEEDV